MVQRTEMHVGHEPLDVLLTYGRDTFRYEMLVYRNKRT